MKIINKKNRGFKLLVAFLLILAQPVNVLAKNKDCWVDIYDDTQYQGKKIHIEGPAKLKNLLKVSEGNWDKRIESVIVGPSATLTVFENKNFKLTMAEMANHPVLMKSLGITKQDILEESELIFGPNSKVHGFGEFHFYHKIRSLKVDCK